MRTTGGIWAALCVTAALVAASTAPVSAGTPAQVRANRTVPLLPSTEVSPEFTALTPARIMDTRPGRSTVDGQANGAGAFKDTRTLTVVGRGGIPAEGVGAVAVNVTVTAATNGGHTTVFPTGGDIPIASNVNYSKGQTVANLVVAKVGSGGRISLFNSASTDVIVDVAGWYPEDSSFQVLNPSRLIDTRPNRPTVDGDGSGWGPISQGPLAVAGRAGIPENGVGSVVLNVTVIAPVAGGFTMVYPNGAPVLKASNLNYMKGQTVSSLVVAKPGDLGLIALYNSARANVIVDVAGWYPETSDFDPLVPARLMDSRPGRFTIDARNSGGGAFSNSRSLKVTGRGGVPSSGVGSVVLSVTATGPSTDGYTTVYPTGQQRPGASNINYAKGQPRAGLVIAKVGDGGQVTLFNSTRADVVVDVYGWSPHESTLGTVAVQEVSLGFSHSCALIVGGVVKCWGRNKYAQVGDGSQVDRSRPITVLGLDPGVTAISSGDTHTCALSTSGYVKCWGFNYYGQLGDGTTTIGTKTVSDLGPGVTSISAGSQHTCAVTSSGGAKCWGDNYYGQLGDGTTSSRSTPVAVSGLESGVASVAAGRENTCAVMTSGAVRCWGRNLHGELGDGSRTITLTPVPVINLDAPVVSVAVGWDHSCAVTTSGAVRCWGDNDHGQLGNGTWFESLTPVAVTGFESGVESITAGNMNTCAVTTEGAALCWGMREPGWSGPDSEKPRLTPTPIPGLESGIASIYADYSHSCAVTTAGAAKCWGSNYYGELGDRTLITRSTPAAVSGLG